MKEAKLIEGYWYKTPDKLFFSCCKCGLTHEINFKIKKRDIYSKWNVIKNER